MNIDSLTYQLNENNFFNTKYSKEIIVIGNSFSEKLNHFTGWLNRFEGEYKKTANYTITRKGEIFEHFSPDFYSDFISDNKKNKKIISIVIENKGWLKKDLKTGKYIDWLGNKYKRRVNVLEKRWRGQQYWDPYTQKQFSNTVKLVKYLCEKYNIEYKCVGHNTFINNFENFSGITYRSNFYRDNTDVNPSWDFKKFKLLVENRK